MRQLKPIQPVPPMLRDMDLLANRLASTTVLDGTSIVLEFEEGTQISMALSATHVRWSAVTAAGAERSGEDAYDAVEIRPGVFFLDFVLADGSMAFSHVVDTRAGRALTVWNEVVETPAGFDLNEFLRPSRIVGHTGAYQPFRETRELLGKRLYCEYSPEAALEHIYVNSVTIVWQWLLSPPELEQEVGIEAVTMWKVGENLYLISTRGEDPIQLTLLIDLDQMRNVGRLFGRGHFGVVDRRCGAKATFLGAFEYPEGYEPG
ncbi:MAG: MoaF N-terminal domain-containing protein [Caulobacteraceae bacterium]